MTCDAELRRGSLCHFCMPWGGLLLHPTQPLLQAESVLSRTSSGGAILNDVVVHLSNPNLPFGGVGESG